MNAAAPGDREDGDGSGSDGGSGAGVEAGDASRLDAVERALGYTFTDRARLAQGLRHSSLQTQGLEPNERLEFLGDAVLGLAVARHLYDRFPAAREGELTRLKAAVVRAGPLARVAERLGLDRAIALGASVQPGAAPPSLFADAFEAVLGAVYLDGGLAAAAGIAVTALEPELAACLERGHASNWKQILQELLQRDMGSPPTYAIVAEVGPDHDKRFEAAALLEERELGRGGGRSKKEAEQEAARDALERLLGPGLEGVREGAPDELPSMVQRPGAAEAAAAEAAAEAAAKAAAADPLTSDA